jgi:RNase H-fold protein (predicted Holliday junction resolvase)
MALLAIDPGKNKFGYAVLSSEKTLLFQGISEVCKVLEIAEWAINTYQIETIVIGDRTGGADFCSLFKTKFAGKGLKIVTIDEDYSSYEGRRRFLVENRKGWRKLIPLGLQSPSEPYDDYVAAILGERYLDLHKEEN